MLDPPYQVQTIAKRRLTIQCHYWALELFTYIWLISMLFSKIGLLVDYMREVLAAKQGFQLFTTLKSMGLFDENSLCNFM